MKATLRHAPIQRVPSGQQPAPCLNCGGPVEPIVHPHSPARCAQLVYEPGTPVVFDGCKVYMRRCDACVGVGQDERSWAEQRRRQDAENLARRLANAGLSDTEVLVLKQLQLVPQERWRHFVPPQSGTLPRCWSGFIHGPTGTGKSTELTAIAYHYIVRARGTWWRPLYLTEERLAKELHRDRRQGTAFKRFMNADLLLLDDLGRTALANWEMDLVVEVLAERHRQRHATVITSNWTLAELSGAESSRHPHTQAPVYGERLTSRLLEAAGGAQEQLNEARRTIITRTYDFRLRRETCTA